MGKVEKTLSYDTSLLDLVDRVQFDKFETAADKMLQDAFNDGLAKAFNDGLTKAFNDGFTKRKH